MIQTFDDMVIKTCLYLAHVAMSLAKDDVSEKKKAGNQ